MSFSVPVGTKLGVLAWTPRVADILEMWSVGFAGAISLVAVDRSLQDFGLKGGHLRHMFLAAALPKLPEPDDEQMPVTVDLCTPPAVRARVKSVHTSQSARELQQVGVELENPGNVWGIAVPPQDWLALGETSTTLMPQFSPVAKDAIARSISTPSWTAPGVSSTAKRGAAASAECKNA